MAQRSVMIPERTSSKNVAEDLKKQRLQLKESKDELKRKLSAVSFESSPLEYRKLKIDRLEIEIAEERLERSWVDMEHQDQNLTDTELNKVRRQLNHRIFELRDKLWEQQVSLRNEEEQLGLAPPLGPDSREAYTFTLLALYKDPKPTSKRGSVQSNMRKSVIKVYESGKDSPSQNQLWCPVLQDYYDKEDMKAAHIVPIRLGPSVVDYIFEKGTGARLNTPDNCLLIHQTVERALDVGNIVLLPADPTESPIKTWKVQVTNRSALQNKMGNAKHLSDLDGTHLVFKNERRPASRFIYFHFIMTLLMIKRDNLPEYKKHLLDLPSQKPFATPGRYLRHSMLLVLAQHAGDLDAEAQTKLLGTPGQETFEEARNLPHSVEEEIGKRVYETREKGEGEDQDEDEEEGR